MEEQIKKVLIELESLNKRLGIVENSVRILSEQSYKTAKREVFNKEIQFLQKCYDKNGDLISEINP